MVKAMRRASSGVSSARRPEQVRGEQLVWIFWQGPGGFGMDLVDEPLDDEAGVDDVWCHRSRSSA
jgi:hypothetical protein